MQQFGRKKIKKGLLLNSWRNNQSEKTGADPYSVNV